MEYRYLFFIYFLYVSRLSQNVDIQILPSNANILFIPEGESAIICLESGLINFSRTSARCDLHRGSFLCFTWGSEQYGCQ